LKVELCAAVDIERYMVAVFPRRQLANRPLANIDLYTPVRSFDDVLDRLICQLNAFLELMEAHTLFWTRKRQW
jgi:hypothetical protein